MIHKYPFSTYGYIVRHCRLPPYDYRDELEDDLEGRQPAGQRGCPAAARRRRDCPPVRVGEPGVAPVRLAR